MMFILVIIIFKGSLSKLYVYFNFKKNSTHRNAGKMGILNCVKRTNSLLIKKKEATIRKKEINTLKQIKDFL